MRRHPGIIPLVVALAIALLLPHGIIAAAALNQPVDIGPAQVPLLALVWLGLGLILAVVVAIAGASVSGNLSAATRRLPLGSAGSRGYSPVDAPARGGEVIAKLFGLALFLMMQGILRPPLVAVGEEFAPRGLVDGAFVVVVTLVALAMFFGLYRSAKPLVQYLAWVGLDRLVPTAGYATKPPAAAAAPSRSAPKAPAAPSPVAGPPPAMEATVASLPSAANARNESPAPIEATVVGSPPPELTVVGAVPAPIRPIAPSATPVVGAEATIAEVGVDDVADATMPGLPPARPLISVEAIPWSAPATPRVPPVAEPIVEPIAGPDVSPRPSPQPAPAAASDSTMADLAEAAPSEPSEPPTRASGWDAPAERMPDVDATMVTLGEPIADADTARPGTAEAYGGASVAAVVDLEASPPIPPRREPEPVSVASEEPTASEPSDLQIAGPLADSDHASERPSANPEIGGTLLFDSGVPAQAADGSEGEATGLPTVADPPSPASCERSAEQPHGESASSALGLQAEGFAADVDSIPTSVSTADEDPAPARDLVLTASFEPASNEMLFAAEGPVSEASDTAPRGVAAEELTAPKPSDTPNVASDATLVELVDESAAGSASASAAAEHIDGESDVPIEPTATPAPLAFDAGATLAPEPEAETPAASPAVAPPVDQEPRPALAPAPTAASGAAGRFSFLAPRAPAERKAEATWSDVTIAAEPAVVAEPERATPKPAAPPSAAPSTTERPSATPRPPSPPAQPASPTQPAPPNASRFGFLGRAAGRPAPTGSKPAERALTDDADRTLAPGEERTN